MPTYSSKFASGLTAIAIGMSMMAASMPAFSKVLRLGVLSSNEHPSVLGAKKFAELVEAETGGSLKVKVYDNSQLGPESQQIAALQGGIQDMFVSPTTTLVNTIPSFGIFDLPFLFENAAEADKILDGKVGEQLLEKMPEKGMVGLAYWENGFRNVTNSKHPINVVKDLEGLKIRVMPNQVYVDMFKALGANPVPLPFAELFTALDTKTVDAQENPFGIIAAGKFYEVQKYLTITNHSYNAFVLTFSKRKWDALSDGEREVIQRAALKARDHERKVSRDQDQKTLAALESYGMQVNEMSAAERQKMRDMLRPVIDKVGKEVGEPLMNLLDQEIEASRKP